MFHVKQSAHDEPLRELAGTAAGELTEKRSRFIAELQPVNSRATATQRIQAVRASHSDASHVVYAFLIGDQRSEDAGLSDDGEPHGTAGRPVMEVLRGSGIRNALLTVTRYFGGTKLGTGGLVKAYGGAAKLAVARARTKPLVERRRIRVQTPYELFEPLRRALGELEATVIEVGYSEEVTLVIEMPATGLAAAQRLTCDISAGTVKLIELE